MPSARPPVTERASSSSAPPEKPPDLVEQFSSCRVYGVEKCDAFASTPLVLLQVLDSFATETPLVGDSCRSLVPFSFFSKCSGAAAALLGCRTLLFSSLANKQTAATMNHFTAHIHRRSNHRGGNLLMKMIQEPRHRGESFLSASFFFFPGNKKGWKFVFAVCKAASPRCYTSRD